jgi:hypothetical protein
MLSPKWKWTLGFGFACVEFFSMVGYSASVPARVEGALRENSVSPEGHGFSRAVNNTAIPGFRSR